MARLIIFDNVLLFLLSLHNRVRIYAVRVEPKQITGSTFSICGINALIF
jgi:hypothetical protein